MVYPYVGPVEILERSGGAPSGAVVGRAGAVRTWVESNDQEPELSGLYAVTFVIDEAGRLRIADRRSEHVACAGGGSVRTAGELFFRIDDAHVLVEEASNQSMGYCPEPESWPELAAVLDRVGIPHPGTFTLELHFRRCRACGQQQVVKDGWFVCAGCESDLPLESNRAEFPSRFLPE